MASLKRSASQMLPLLALEVSHTDVKRSRDDGAVFFKAYKRGEFRQLSNLFGPVEWLYQSVKFRLGSGVHEWLINGATKEWTIEEFDVARKAMRHDGKLASYIDVDGAVASGLLAQMCSLIARNPESLDARKRVAFILGLEKPMTADQQKAWNVENVLPELDFAARDDLMLQLLREKYQIPHYRALLLSTGDRELHEARGRGPPHRWEFHPLSDAHRADNAVKVAADEAPKWTEGGNVLGNLMTRVRAEERARV